MQAGWQVEFGSLSKSHFHDGIHTVANGRGEHSKKGNCKSDCYKEENHSNEHASYEIPPLTNIFESPIILSLDSLLKKSPKTNCD